MLFSECGKIVMVGFQDFFSHVSGSHVYKTCYASNISCLQIRCHHYFSQNNINSNFKNCLSYQVYFVSLCNFFLTVLQMTCANEKSTYSIKSALHFFNNSSAFSCVHYKKIRSKIISHYYNKNQAGDTFLSVPVQTDPASLLIPT